MASSHANGGRYALTGKQNAFLDLVALMFIPFFASVHFGVMTSALAIFGGYDFAEPLWTVLGLDISVSLLVIVFGLAWIMATNEIDGSDYEPWEFAILVFALLTPILYVLVPAFEELVMMNGYSQLMFTAAVTAASTYMGYTA